MTHRTFASIQRSRTSEDQTGVPMLSHRGVFEMRKNPFWVGSVLYLSLTIAFCNRVWAQQLAADTSAANPLLRVLQAKGILTQDEVAQISQASSPGDADRLVGKTP